MSKVFVALLVYFYVLRQLQIAYILPVALAVWNNSRPLDLYPHLEFSLYEADDLNNALVLTNDFLKITKFDDGSSTTQTGPRAARVVPNVSFKNLGPVLREEVQKDAVICSDENTAYQTVNKEFKAHHTVCHSKYEYILKTTDGISAGTNHCESFFSLLKRGVNGAWHNVSREHLHRYVNEFAFRWNTRKLTDGERMETAVPLISGKRLTYRQVI